jgi:hypothetical protein
MVQSEPEILRCSFCNKEQSEVRKLIAGPTVFICDQCVEVCNDIIADNDRFEAGKHWGETPSPSEPPRVEHATMAALMNRLAELCSFDQWLLVMYLLSRLHRRDVNP